MKQKIIQRFIEYFNKLEILFALLALIGLILYFFHIAYSHIFLILGIGALAVMYFLKGHFVSYNKDILPFEVFVLTLLFWSLSLTGLGILCFLNNYTVPVIFLFIGLLTLFSCSIIFLSKYYKYKRVNTRGQVLRIIIWFALGSYCLLSWYSII